RQQEDAHSKGCDETSYDHDGEGALGIGTDGVRECGGEQSQRGHQHGHHDGPQPQHGALNRGVLDGIAQSSQLIDVFEHDDSGLHRDAEQRQEPDAGRNAEIGAGKQKGEHTANGCDGYVNENQQCPFEGFEHGVKNDEDDENGNGKYDEQARIGSFLALVFSLPIQAVASGQLDLFVYFFDRLFHRAAKVTAANTVLDSHITAVALAIDFRPFVLLFDLAELG